jgi:hypothetical protein
MPIAKITGQGLTAIALSVAGLWGCLVGERVIVNQANREAYRTMRDMRSMRNRQRPRTIPVSAPVYHVLPSRPALG